MPKSVAIRSSDVLTLTDLLRAICGDPAPFTNSTPIKTALHSQGGLASLEFNFEVNGINKCTRPMSLNTLKSYANAELERGFQGLNDLRIAAAEAIQTYEKRNTRSNKRTKVGLTIRVSELEQELEATKKANFILLQALSVALTDINNIRDTADPSLREKRANDALQTMRAIVSLNPPPLDLLSATASIVTLADYR